MSVTSKRGTSLASSLLLLALAIESHRIDERACMLQFAINLHTGFSRLLLGHMKSTAKALFGVFTA